MMRAKNGPTERSKGRPLNPRRSGHLSVAEANTVLLQLADLLEAGIAVVEALDVLAGSSVRGGMASLALDLQAQLLHGKSFSDALARHPRLFDAMTLMLVRQSESTGDVAGALRDAAGLWERRATYRLAIRRALAYPIFVCCVSAGLMTGLMIWSVPAFAQLFASFDAPLPALTRTIVALSGALRKGVGARLPLAACVGVLTAILAVMRGASSLRRPIDAFGMRWRARALRLLVCCVDRLPAVARWRRDALFAEWGMALAALLDAGIPLHAALQAMASGHGRSDVHPHAGDDTALQQGLVARLARGQTLAQAMRLSKAFNEDALRLTAVAERTGSLSRMLGTLARRRSVGVHARIERCIRWIEPAALLLCGAVVGVVIVALYLPIIKLGEVI